MVANDMARECKAMLDACPACEFEGLEVGKHYCYKPSYGESVLVVVGQMAPKRQQAIVSVNRGATQRIYKGNWTGSFIELDADLCALIGVTHEMIVTAAVAAGSEVPPVVRRQYPHLFVEIPERFAQAHHTAVERVQNALSPTWVRRESVSVATIDEQIRVAHESLAVTRDTRCQAVAANPDLGVDYDQYITGSLSDIDFYRWLRRQIDVGGVFHI